MAGNQLPPDGPFVDPLILLSVSQHPDLLETDTPGEIMMEAGIGFDGDVGAEVVEESRVANCPSPCVLTENDPNGRGRHAADDRIVTQPKAKRTQVHLSKKMLLATAALFLDDKYSELYNNEEAVAIGQICECPREKNGKKFRIDWKSPLPEDLQKEWLRTTFPGTKETRDSLRNAITAYDIRYRKAAPVARAASAAAAGVTRKPAAVARAARKTGTTTNASTTNASVALVGRDVAINRPWVRITAPRMTGPVPCVAVPVVGRGRGGGMTDGGTTTSTPNNLVDPMSKVASIMTGSSISTLSQSYIASPEIQIRNTRTADDLESLSDDESNLDEEDNMYNKSDEVGIRGIDDETDEEDEEVEDEMPPEPLVRHLVDQLEDITWNFSAVDGDVHSRVESLPTYSGPNGLKEGVAESFQTPFQCLGECGGLDYEFVSRLARKSNDYAKNNIMVNDRNGRVSGHSFRNITTEEMYHFLGITLRISLSPVDWGGYPAYFQKGNKTVYSYGEISFSDGFARHYMSLIRYKQIRAAFHPEDRSASNGGDKCYQLRHAINTINQASRNTKFIGENVSFDEGGVGSRHRLNPVRQYNKDKPQKYRVDFFILACPVTYFIHHIDVYQGKNASNVGIHRSVRSMPTTQKAVLNAVLSTDMHNEIAGARHIALDNRYQCPELALILRQRFMINSTGTCRKNRKGWKKDLMNLEKKEGRGTYKFCVDTDNKILCCQWADSKVVNVVSSLLSTKISTIEQQVGNQKKEFPCPWVVTKYQMNMQGVDKSDQMRAAGGGFASKAHSILFGGILSSNF